MNTNTLTHLLAAVGQAHDEWIAQQNIDTKLIVAETLANHGSIFLQACTVPGDAGSYELFIGVNDDVNGTRTLSKLVDTNKISYN